MRLILQPTNLRARDRLDHWILQSLRTLLPLVRIEEARVRLEYVPGASPPYRAAAHLVIPGPDLRAEASDFTAHTAFARVMADLKIAAQHRAARRRSRPGALRLSTIVRRGSAHR